jgi:hypothetical protein
MVSTMPRIVIREGRGGFVGTTGTVLTIEPDGSFSEAPFVNSQVRSPERRGTLPDGAMAAIERVLAETAFATLPSRLGGAPTANPHEIRIEIGPQSVTLVQPPSAPPAGAGGADPAIARFRAVLHAVRSAAAAGAAAR